MTDRERLIQEEYVDTKYGPWKVLVICQLLNKTTWKQVEKVVSEIFHEWPSPGKLALMSFDDMRSLENLLRPLGFVKSRTKNLLKMSLQYCEERSKWADNWIMYEIFSFAGCGRYAEDAWKLFVLKETCYPLDRRLRDYAKEYGLFREPEEARK